MAVATLIIFCLFFCRRNHSFVLKIGKFRFPFFTPDDQLGLSLKGWCFFSGILVGILWMASLGHWHFGWQPPEDKIQQDVIVTGRVTELQRYDDYQILSINVDTMNSQPFSGGVVARVNNAFGQFTVHQRLRLTLVVKPASSLVNPGYDRRAVLVAKKTSLSGYVPADGGVKVLSPARTLHHKLSSILHNAGYSRWMQALFTGNRNGLTREDWTLLQQTGTAHLFSISGLHVAMVSLWAAVVSAPVMALIIGVLPVNYNKVNLSVTVAVSVLVATTLYASVANWQIPVFRAWLCIGLLYVLVIFKKYWTWYQRFLVMLACCIVVFPRSVYSSSLYLSAGAVMLILLIQWRFPLQRGLWWVKAIGVMRLQCLLSLLLIPFTILFFEQASWLTFPVNLLAIPWISVVVPIGLAGMVLAYCGQNANLFLDIADTGLMTLMLWLENCQRFMVVTPLPSLSSTSIFCALLMLLCWLCPAVPYRLVCSLILVIPLFSHLLPPSENRWVVHVFDVGHGTATVVTRGGRGVVIDTGPSYLYGNAFERVVWPSLKKIGVRYIDKLIITHGDDDHAGGAQTVASMLVNNKSKNNIIRNTNGCMKGETFHWQGLEFEFLWPDKPDVADTNHYSCVVRVTDGRQSALFTGDIDTSAEYALLYHRVPLNSDVLIVPHHGSRTSSSPAFIDAVAPRYAVFTTGYRHRWALPHSEVESRYLRRGIQTMRSAVHGYIRFSFSQHQLEVSDYGTREKRRWYDPRVFGKANIVDST